MKEEYRHWYGTKWPELEGFNVLGVRRDLDAAKECARLAQLAREGFLTMGEKYMNPNSI